MIHAAKSGPDGTFRLTWPSVPNRTYTVLTSTNLASGFWALTNRISAQPPGKLWVWPMEGDRQRFFRVAQIRSD